MKNNNKILSESLILNNFLNKLNFNKKESFNFKNDGAILKEKKNKNIVVTNDTILESVDFFTNDNPESIAQKIITYNLSDLSSMGADPYSYTLSLNLPEGIGSNWLKKFTNKLYYLQKKYNFFLLGGDITKSKQISISANFFGYVKKNHVMIREFPKIDDNIWVTGNIGDSHIGLLLRQKKININKDIRNYFINKYLYPKPCMIGCKINKFCKYSIDISDGFFGDLSKLLNTNSGADINFSDIPFSNNAKKLINKKINPNSLLTAGDDYELIFTSSSKNDLRISTISNKYDVKITKVGRIINKKGIFLDGKKIKRINNSFQYFF